MAETVGRVTFIVGLDGHTLPAEARAIGNQIAALGSESGDQFGAKFSDALNRRLEAAGSRAAVSFGRNFSRSLQVSLQSALRSFNGVDTIANRLTKSFKGVNDSAGQLAIEGDKSIVVWGELLEDIGELRQVFDDVAAASGGMGGGGSGIRDLGDAFDDSSASGRRFSSVLAGISGYFKGLRSDGTGLSKMLEGHSLHWKDLSHNTRQWTLIIAAVMAGFQELSVLGSAAGAGIIALGGAFESLLVGGLGLIAVFSNLSQEIEDAPPAMRDAIRQFQSFKNAISEINDVIAQAAFDEMGDAFTRIEANMRGLTPTLSKLGTMLGGLFDDFADNTKVGSAAFAEIQQSIENAVPNFDQLARTAGDLGVALLRSFNRAQPLIEQFLGWVDKLVQRFDEFTQSSGFDTWIANAMNVFGAFGRLLDATGRALNDLVTPGAVARTIQFLDNLTGFMPSLSSMLDILGRLDIFGLLAQGLNDFGRELAPLAPAIGVMADALNRIASILIGEFAQSLGAIAGMIAPLVADLAGFLDAIPEDVVRGVANGILVLAGAFVILKGAMAAGAIGNAIDGFITSATKMNAISGTLAGTLRTGLARAGLWTAMAAAVVVGAEALNQFYRETTNVEGRAADIVASNASMADAYKELGKSVFGVLPPLTDTDAALDNLTGSGAVGMFGSLKNALIPNGPAANALSQALGEMSPHLARMAEKDLPSAVERFRGLADELGATDQQVLNMLNTMPEFKSAMEDAAAGPDGLTTSTELLNFVMKATPEQLEAIADGAAAIAPEMESAAAAAELQADALELLTGKSLAALDAVEGVADGITTLGSAFRGQQSAAITYQESLNSLNQSIADNGKEWALSSEAGIANRQAILDMADSTLQLASQNYNLTGSAEEAAAAIQTGRDAVIAALQGMDLGGLSAEEYADKLGLIPGDVETLISANTAAGTEMADAFATRLYELGLLEVNPVIAADAAKALATEAETRRLLSDLGVEVFTPTIDANPVPAEVIETQTRLLMEKLGETTFTPTIDADNTEANSKTQDSADRLYALDASLFVPDIDVDNSDALSGTSAVQSALDNLKDKTVYLTTVISTVGGSNTVVGPNGVVYTQAAGGIADRPTLSLWGEAGPEAIVPLNRPLSQVNPNVRWLSAVAQGRPMAGGSMSSGGNSKTLNIASGAITIQGDRAPETTATLTVNRIAERIAG